MNSPSGEQPECFAPHIVPDKTVLTVLIRRNESVFIVVTPSDPADPETIDNFWLPSTILTGPKTTSDWNREAERLAAAWTGIKGLWVDDGFVMSANMPYPLPPPGEKASDILYGTIFMRVDVGLRASRQTGRNVARPHPDLLESAMEDDEYHFHGSWLSKEDVRASFDQDMAVLRPIRKVLGLVPEVPSGQVVYKRCAFHPDTQTSAFQSCQKCAKRRGRLGPYIGG